MDPSTPLPNPNPGNHGPGVYQIGGVPVEFPYKPYGSQLAFMGRVISTLDRARRQGRCSALLESPTGTGKTLSLLCSSLAWQRHHQQRFFPGPAAPSPTPPPGTPAPDHLVFGGGFIPESQPSSKAEETPMPATARAQRRQTSPKIYYASRTHSQISQVIRELRKTSYRVPMAILASRKHYCTNKHVCTRENLDEECKLLLKDEGQGCSEFKNAAKVKSHPSLQKGGCYEVHDIEDLVKVGRRVKGCSYFAAQAMAEEAQIVFCPYSYIVNPIVRRAMDIDLKGSIVILDEAHNIEDIARDAGSLDVEEDVLFALQTELGQLCMTDNNGAVIYQPLHDMIQGIISWIGDRKMGLQKCEFEHYSSFWTGGKAMNELQQAGITQQYFLILQECATKAIKAAYDAESVGNRLNGMSAIALEGLVSSLSYLFSGNGSYAVDYQLALQRYVKRDGSNAADGWICKLSLWCLNPAVVFKEIANQVLSVILTSGTLSPMGSFASELGIQFETCMEAPHVIDVESQLWAAVLPTGPANCQLNASYKTADGYAFQDGLGVSLEEICKITPGGVLVFFPSYKLLEKVHHRWNQTGQWSRLNAQKSLFVETRGAGDEFESVLKGYYDAIRGDTIVVQEKSRLGLKRGSIKRSSGKVCSKTSPRGAAFLAVFRGKVSEGINFSDENARVVVIVGIPFPNKNDIQVVLKKKYNDTYRSSKHLLSGSEWYCHQAFRALNQAAGRCIRHRFDYGAIILLDERFKEERNLMYISKWLKNSIKHYNSFDESLVGLKLFFETAQNQFGPTSNGSRCEVVSQSETNFDCGEATPSLSKSNLNQSIPKQKIMKAKVNHQKSSKIINQDEAASTKPNELTKSSKLGEKGHLCSPKDCCNEGGKAASERNVKSTNCCYSGSVDLESSNLKCKESMLVEHCETSLNMPEDSEKGTTSDHNASPRKVLNFKNLHQGVDNFDQYLEGPSFSPSTFSNVTVSEGACTPAYSPVRMEYVDTCNPEKEICLNMSVTSHNQKKRKQRDLSSHQIDCFSSDTDSFYPVDSISCISREIDQVSESPCPDNYSRNKHQRPREGMLRKNEFPISMSNFSKEKKLKLCCLFCRKQLGLYENDFLVNCSLSASSKVYLAYVLKHGPPKDSNLDCSLSPLETDVPVVVCDTSSVDHLIFDRESKEVSSQKGIWSEEDGCVFRIVTCPYCTVPKTCLGMQIIAANSANIHLLNKVLFYADHLEKNDEETQKEKGATAICLDVNSQGSALFEIEKYAYSSLPQKLGFLNARKPKLSLPKGV